MYIVSKFKYLIIVLAIFIVSIITASLWYVRNETPPTIDEVINSNQNKFPDNMKDRDMISNTLKSINSNYSLDRLITITKEDSYELVLISYSSSKDTKSDMYDIAIIEGGDLVTGITRIKYGEDLVNEGVPRKIVEYYENYYIES